MAQSTKEEIALERMKHKLAINILKIEPIQDIFNRIGVELGEYYNWSDSTIKSYHKNLTTLSKTQQSMNLKKSFYDMTYEDHAAILEKQCMDRSATIHRPYKPDTVSRFKNIVSRLSYCISLCDLGYQYPFTGSSWDINGKRTNNKKRVSRGKRTTISKNRQTEIRELVSLPKSFTILAEKTFARSLAKDLCKQKNGYAMGGLLMLYLGLRPGECCALTFGKITPTSDDLQVVHVVEQLDGENNIRASLKTKNAYRTLPIPTELVDQLKERMQFIQENLDPSQNIESCYLVNEESDFTNPCKRAHFNKYIKQKLLLAKVDEKAITYAETIIKSDTSVKETEPTTYLMRRNFATLMSSVCAMNNDELQYVMGHTLEHKKRRSDFIDPEILKHIAQKMNRRHLLSPFPNHTTTLNKGALRIEDVAQINLIATAESITSQQLPIVVDVYTNSPIDFITICCTSPVGATHTENADPSSVDQPVVICDFDSKQQSLENTGRINIEQAYYRAVNKNSNKITTLEQKLESSVKP